MLLNARILQQPLTGVGRYLSEVLDAWPGEPPVRIDPPRWAVRGVKGHAWEQLVLPAKVGRGLLWSPVHSGPLAVARQVVTVHDLVPLDHPEWLNRGFARWYRFMLPRLVHRHQHHPDHDAVAEYRADVRVSEAAIEQDFEIQPSGRCLKINQTRKLGRRRPLNTDAGSEWNLRWIPGLLYFFDYGLVHV